VAQNELMLTACLHVITLPLAVYPANVRSGPALAWTEFSTTGRIHPIPPLGAGRPARPEVADCGHSSAIGYK